MDDIPKVLRIANDVEDICEFDGRYSFAIMRHLLRLTAAINACLGDSCPEDENLNILLFEADENANVKKGDFCLVMKPFVRKYYNGTDNVALKLQTYNVSQVELHKLDNPNLTTLQMISILKQIFKRASKPKNTKTFNQFLMAVFAVGIAGVLYSFSNQTTAAVTTQKVCPYTYRPTTTPDNNYVDETFQRLPYILWRSAQNVYTQDLKVDRDDQITMLAKSVLDENDVNENVDESVLRRDLFNLYPALEFGFPLRTVSIEARSKVNKFYFDQTPDQKRYLELWYFINLKTEIRNKLKKIKKDWNQEVHRWFETNDAEDELYPIMCELFKEVPEQQTMLQDVCYPRTDLWSDPTLDSTFQTVPKIMLPNLQKKFEPNDKKDEQIKSLARLVFSKSSATIHQIKHEKAVQWKRKVAKLLPDVAALPYRELFSASTRRLLTEEYKTNPLAQLSELYWENFVYDLLLRFKIQDANEIEKVWTLNVLNRFHGRPTEPFLDSLLCEMFQPNDQCTTIPCQLKSAFFQKPTLAAITAKDIENENDYWNGFHWKIVDSGATCSLDPIFKEYAHYKYPLSAMANVFLLFESKLKLDQDLPLDEQLKMIAHWMINPDRGRTLQDTWPETWFKPLEPAEYYEKWRYVHAIPGAKDIYVGTPRENRFWDNHGTRRDLLYKGSLHNRQSYVDFIAHKQLVDPKHRSIQELYRVDFLIDLTLLLRELGLESSIEDVWAENVIRWFHRRPLRVPQLESLLCEAFPRIQ